MVVLLSATMGQEYRKMTSLEFSIGSFGQRTLARCPVPDWVSVSSLKLFADMVEKYSLRTLLRAPAQLLDLGFRATEIEDFEFLIGLLRSLQDWLDRSTLPRSRRF